MKFYSVLLPSRGNFPPRYLKFYQLSNMSLLDTIAGYQAQQRQSETTCQFKPSKQYKNCSFDLLNEYHEQCGYLSTKSSWINHKQGYPNASIEIPMCDLERELSAEKAGCHLLEYIYRKGIRHIVTFGDSQGKRYKLAFMQLLKKATTFDCRLVKQEQEGFTFGLEYFIDGVDPSFVHPVNRTCQSCSSSLLRCEDRDGYELFIEHIAMLMNADASIVANESFCATPDRKTHPLCTATTQQEFVFKHYFASQPKYPDLLLIFTTFAHDRERPFSGIHKGFQHLIQVIDHNVPASSTIVWYTTTPFHEKNMYPDLANMVCENGYSVNEKILSINHILFHMIRDKLRVREDRVQMYGFLDLYELQLGLEQDWALDWVHSQPDWYIYVIQHTAILLNNST